MKSTNDNPVRIYLQSRFADLLCQDSTQQALRTWRHLLAKWKGLDRTLQVFIKVDDPYSYLLIQALNQLRLADQGYHLSIKPIGNYKSQLFPELEKWQAYSIKDAKLVAKKLGLKFPATGDDAPKDQVAVTDRIFELSDKGDLEKIEDLLEKFWQGETFPPESSKKNNSCVANEALLKQSRQYLSGLILFRGETFWGIDRLALLEKVLNPEKPPKYELRSQPTSKVGQGLPIELFFSIRSPYSYLALEKVISLAKRYQLKVQYKPVIPMAMRGYQIPDMKKWYIFHDAAREARKSGIPYGRIADPLGKGVERCYEVYEYAVTQGREREFLQTATRAIYAEGVLTQTDRGMKKIVENSGLNWDEARKFLGTKRHIPRTKKNQEELTSLGLWGVPSFKYGDFSCWGQDRLWALEDAILNSFNESSS